MSVYQKMYLLERKGENGFKERIWAWMPCKGWKIIKTIYV